MNPLQVPLLNTLVLLRRGVTVTWAHHSLLNGGNSIRGLFFTVSLGGYFTALQASEYYAATFGLADSAYGRTFFMATGFHGIHVLIGTLFLFVGIWRTLKKVISPLHHLGIEFSI